MWKVCLLISLSMLISVASAEQTYWKQGDPFPPLQSGRPWPKLRKVIVDASATSKNGLYIYSYTVHNSEVNWLPICAFDVDIRIDPLVHALSSSDISRVHSGAEHAGAVYEAARIAISDIDSPVGWGMPEPTGPCRWFVSDLREEPMIAPKEAKRGYRYRTTFPVGIRDFRAEGYSFEFSELKINVPVIPKEKYLFYVMSPDLISEVNKGIEFIGKTIAPVAPPEPFTTSSWTLRMSEYAVEARKQKWIKTDKGLAEIKRLISSLNTEDIVRLKTAVKKTEAYVIAEKKKGNMTDEADALVRLNAQYLLRRIGNPEGKPYEGAK